MRSSPRLSALGCASALAIITAAGLVTPAAAQAQPAAATRAYAIPAGPLAPALNHFATETGLALVYPAELANGRRTAGVTGQTSTDQALARLLAGTGLAWRFNDARTVVIEPVRTGAAEDGRVLGPVRVEGAEGGEAFGGPPRRGEGVAQLGGIRGGQDQETVGYRPRVATIASGVPTAIEDIPRSLTIVTQSQIRDQDISDTRELLARLPGITVEQSQPEFTTFYARGFQLQSFQVDGGAARSFTDIGRGYDSNLFDLSAYERVELVRGPNSGNIGFGSFGGSINFVRKRPSARPTESINVTLGSWGRAQLQYDFSTPSIMGAPIGFRGVINYNDQGFFYEKHSHVANTFYGILDFPLGELASLEIGVHHSTADVNGWPAGVPRYLEGPLLNVPFDANFSPEWVYRDQRQTELFSRLAIDFDANWQLQGQLALTRGAREGYEWDGRPVLSVRDDRTPASLAQVGTSRIEAFYDDAKTESLGLDFRLTGRLSTFGLDHNILASADWRESVLKRGSAILPFGSYFSLRDYYDTVFIRPATKPEITSDRYQRRDGTGSRTNTFGVLFQDTISWRDKIDLNVAIRRYESDTQAVSATFLTQSNAVLGPFFNGEISVPRASFSGSKPTWTPNYSLVFKPIKGMAFSVNAVDGTIDQSTFFTVQGKPLDPRTFDNKDFTFKYGRDAWIVSISGYDSHETNVATEVAPAVRTCPPTGLNTCYFEGGALVDSKGVDVEVNGELWRGFEVIGSYNYGESVRTSDHLDVMTQSPKSSAKVFAAWRPDALPKWRFRGGVSYRAEVYALGTNRFYTDAGVFIPPAISFTYKEPSATTYDLGLSYALSDRYEIDLFVENITDERYLSQISNPNGGQLTNIYADPRNFTLTLRARDWRHLTAVSATPGAVFFGKAADWYGGLAFGYHVADPLTGRSTGRKPNGEHPTWDWDIEQDYSVEARVGYRLDAFWRGEAEVGLRPGQVSRIGEDRAGAFPTGVCFHNNGFGSDLNLSRCDAPAGKVDVYTGLVNVIRDFRADEARVRPFVGIGIGVGRAAISGAGRFLGAPDVNESRNVVGGRDVDHELALQLQTGLSLALTSRLKLDVSYRHLMINDLDWVLLARGNTVSATTGLPSSPGNAPNFSGRFTGDYRDQAVTLGLRWALGAR
jgi:iron complex outermembrane receptor protein/outer membrane receptor for ferric coprogen and ferric-rhodotorulic acid